MVKLKLKGGLRLYTTKTKYYYLDRIILLTVILISIIYGAISLSINLFSNKELPKHVGEVNEKIKEEEVMVNDSLPINEATEDKEDETGKQEAVKEYRMTYYFTGDDTNSGNTTASGKKTNQFKINEKGWYTYEGKLVVATASKRLLSWEQYKNSKEQTYNLYDELILTINGIDYEAIVLDVCGACMSDTKIDLFVKDRASGLDTKILVKVNN